MSEPDWEKLAALATLADELSKRNELTPAAFAQIMDEGKAAVNGQTQYLEALAKYDPQPPPLNV
jgi:hypothetical protein